MIPPAAYMVLTMKRSWSNLYQSQGGRKMLKSLDILIGFAVIMLVVAMAVTLIVEWFLRLLKMRGTKLLEGVEMLVHQIDPKLITAAHAKEIATQVLTHPLAARGCKLAEVIQR